MSPLRLISSILLIMLIPAAGYAAIGSLHPQTHGSDISPASTVNTSLSISVHGNATSIGNSTGTSEPQQAAEAASVSLPWTVSGTITQSPPERINATASATISSTILVRTNGTIVFNITGTSLVIGKTTYKVVNGTGIFNQQSLVVVLHATVTNGSSTGQLILIGDATGAISSTGNVNVTFSDPESKLAGQFFLSLTGQLTIS